MLPAMWRNEPCMNIEAKTVSQAGSGFSAGIPFAFKSPVLQTIPRDSGPLSVWRATAAQCAPGWVSASGIAPNFMTACVSGPLKNDPPWRIASRYATTFATISSAVTNGNRSVGMLSLIGITGRRGP